MNESRVGNLTADQLHRELAMAELRRGIAEAEATAERYRRELAVMTGEPAEVTARIERRKRDMVALVAAARAILIAFACTKIIRRSLS